MYFDTHAHYDSGAFNADWKELDVYKRQDKDVDDNIPTSKDDSTWKYTGKGTVTEIYIDDADATVTVVEINYYLGQVSKVKSDSKGEYVTVKAISTEPKLDDNAFYACLLYTSPGGHPAGGGGLPQAECPHGPYPGGGTDPGRAVVVHCLSGGRDL